MRNNTFTLIAILILALLSLYIVLPIDHPAWLEEALSGDSNTTRDLAEMKLGLDLQGGTQVLLEADLAEGQEIDSSSMDAAQRIIDSRVNGLGVAEAVVQRQGDERIIVELPGVDNPDQAIDTLRSTGQLEFVAAGAYQNELFQDMIINTTNQPTVARDMLDNMAEELRGQVSIPYPDEVFETVFTGEVLQNAQVVQGNLSQLEIGFEIKNEWADEFLAYTSQNIGQLLVIVLDGRILSAPYIRAAIGDSGVIEGRFSREEADSLAIQMRYGALPVPLKVIDVNSIGASLGQESVQRSLTAGIMGLIGVLLFMLALYRLPGFLSCIALAMYVLFNLALFKLIPVTLTLPGIAGFVLSMGMAVDANILIFERMKEEVRSGRSIRMATEAGFSRAVFATRTFMRSFLATNSERIMASRGLLGY